jgi:hypothetical protein
MSYRPITDIWILTRAKLKNKKKFYGAYLGGFPERARALMACRWDEPVLHVCGGMARDYPYRRGFGCRDRTLDLDPECEPDFLQDARDSYPLYIPNQDKPEEAFFWSGILIDPPYSEQDAAHYKPGPEKYPRPNLLVKNALEALPPGGRVGIIHYIVPSPPPGTVFIASVGIICGFNNRIRAFSVFEKPLD